MVVGAGAGGVAAAATLQHRGYRTLLVEALPRVGGRASTIDIDGFGVSTGAQIFEIGGANAALFDELGVPLRVRRSRRPVVLRVGRFDLPLMSGPLGVLLQRLVIPVVGGLARRWGRFRPRPGDTLDDVLRRRRAPLGVRRVARNITSAMFAAEPSDVEAAVVFDYLTKPGGMVAYGVHPEGAIGPWSDLADHFSRHGGTLWLSSTATGLGFAGNGSVETVRVRRTDGTEVAVRTTWVISNVGPAATIDLAGEANLPAEYVERVRRENRPGTLITINLATREPVRRLRSLVFFGLTERMCYANAASDQVPSSAPSGWHLYCVTSTPHPASSGFDRDAEVAALEREAHEHFPELTGARVLSVAVCTGDWPGQRAILGHDQPAHTPVPNLYNVGDGARPPLGAGQSGCVESARQVADAITADQPSASPMRSASSRRT